MHTITCFIESACDAFGHYYPKSDTVRRHGFYCMRTDEFSVRTFDVSLPRSPQTTSCAMRFGE